MLDRASTYLQKHPIIILIMFIISVLSGIMTIVLGWETFYNNYLSASITIPVWLFLLLGLVLVSLFIFRNSNGIKLKELETVEGKEFGVQQVNMDGKKFVNCTFDGTELLFKGKNGFSLQHNQFKTPPRITFSDYAGTTVSVLKALANSDEFRPFIEKTFFED